MSTKQRKEKEKEARRTAIVAAAERLFAAKGFDRVTMDDVAREAGLAKGTLYLYFDNKETLYVAVVILGTGIMGGMVEDAMAGEKKGLSKAYAGGLAYYEFSKKHPIYFSMMIDARQRCSSGSLGDAIRDEFARGRYRTWRAMADAVRTGIADGTIRRDAEPRKTATFLIEAITSMIKASLETQGTRDGAPAARDEIVYFTLDMLKHAIENEGDL